MDKLLKMLRIALYDNSEPYIYSDEDLNGFLNIAAYAYSKYNPVKRRGKIKLLKGVTDYVLPDDYQTWVDGLSEGDVAGNSFLLNRAPVAEAEICYTYLANRTKEEIPIQDCPLIIDYCFYSIVSGQIKEQSEISSIKLGQGLQIQFSGVSDIEKLAESKMKNFNEKLARTFGGWV